MTKRTKRKPTTKRTQKTKPTIKTNNRIKWFALLAFTCMALFIVLGLRMQTPNETPKVAQVAPDLDKALMDKMRAMLSDEKRRLDQKPLDGLLQSPSTPLPPEPSAKNELPKTQSVKPETKSKKAKIAQEQQTQPSEAADYAKNIQKEPKVIKFDSKKLVKYSGKPRMAIIIDDVSFAHHVDKIKRIPYAITPSILPATNRHPNSHELANSFSFYMVHLPMEAMSHNSPESKTLLVSDSKESISQWIDILHKQFPKATYYNNHTGSRFTANEKSMDYLISVLKERQLVFLDSRTTPQSVAVEIGKRYGMDIHVRDVFLDNSYEKEAIKTQLKEAVEIAKARGRAIAIGHPHANTLSVLQNAGKILDGVEVVYVKDL
jgi:hypothetical protein